VQSAEIETETLAFCLEGIFCDGRHLGRGSDGRDVRVLEDGTGELERLVKSDGDDEEGESFRHADRVDGDVEEVCCEKSDEEAEDGGDEGGEG
jgi:hypothetical protein